MPKKKKIVVKKTKAITKRSPDRWKFEESLRQAELNYIIDIERRPAEYWWNQLCAQYMALGTFMARVSKGQWLLNRNKYWEAVSQEFLRQTKYRVVRDQVRELQQYQQIHETLFDLATPHIVDGAKVFKVKPRSYEGIVRAMLKLDAAANDARQSVLTLIEPDLVEEAAKGADSVFTPEEVHDVSKMLLERRQREQAERLAAGDPHADAIDTTYEGGEEADEESDD